MVRRASSDDDVPSVEFPGDHGGFLTAPGEFAKTLRTVLAAKTPQLSRRQRLHPAASG
jgi:hypothetical protein